MKKVNLLLVLLSLFLLTTAYASPGADIKLTGPENNTFESEKEVTLKIAINSVVLDIYDGIKEIKLKVPYDKDYLTFISSEKTSHFLMNTDTSTEGIIDITLKHIKDVEPENQNPFTGGEVLTLKFKTKSLESDHTLVIAPENGKITF